MTDAEAEAPIFWLPDTKSLLIGKDPELGKIEGRKRRVQQRTRWLDGINEHELEEDLGDGKGQECLSCCSPWAHKESDRMCN